MPSPQCLPRASPPIRAKGRPARALLFLLRLTQGLVALSGLRTLGLEGVAPVGLYPNLYYLTQGLVALAGLRTLGFRGVAPVGLYPSSYYLSQGLVALSGLRTLGFGGVAPLGLCSFYLGLPKVWSSLQGYAPWALKGSPL